MAGGSVNDCGKARLAKTVEEMVMFGQVFHVKKADVAPLMIVPYSPSVRLSLTLSWPP